MEKKNIIWKNIANPLNITEQIGKKKKSRDQIK